MVTFLFCLSPVKNTAVRNTSRLAFSPKMAAWRDVCSNLPAFLEAGNVICISREFSRLCKFRATKTTLNIFVREQYVDLYSRWKECHHGFLLVGTPGIGKTQFCILTLLLCLGDGSAVILDRGKKTVLVFDIGSCRRVKQESLLNDLDTDTTEYILIADMKHGLAERWLGTPFSKILDVKSPSSDLDNSTKYEFHDGATLNTVILSPFSTDELIEACEKTCSEETVKRVRAGSIFAGGSFRNSNKGDSAQVMVDEAISKMLGKSVGSTMIKRKEKHCVVHWFPKLEGGYDKRLCSLYACERYCSIATRVYGASLFKLSNNADIKGVFRGDMFENRMHAMFTQHAPDFTVEGKVREEQKGYVTCETRKLLTTGVKSRSSHEETIEIVGHYRFKSLEDILSSSLSPIFNIFFWPKYRTLEAADCFMVIRTGEGLFLLFFQDTVAVKHPVTGKGLMKIKTIIKEKLVTTGIIAKKTQLKARLIFLTPPATYVNFTAKQRITIKGGAATRSSPVVDQFVWKMVSVGVKTSSGEVKTERLSWI